MTPLPFLPAPLHIYLYTQLSARLEAEVEAAPGAPPLTAADALLDLLAESGPKANDASMYPVADAISALISCPPVLSDPDMGLQRHIVGRLLKMLGFSFTAAPAAGGSPGSKGGGPSSSRAGGAPNRSASVILPGVSAAGGRMSSHASAHDAPAASAPGGPSAATSAASTTATAAASVPSPQPCPLALRLVVATVLYRASSLEGLPR